MEKVIVLGLSGCSHCKALMEALTKANILFKFLDVDLKENSDLADRMEALLKIDNYPMVIIEGVGSAKYLHLVSSIEDAKESPVGYATKIGCVSTDSMVVMIKKYIK